MLCNSCSFVYLVGRLLTGDRMEGGVVVCGAVWRFLEVEVGGVSDGY